MSNNASPHVATHQMNAPAVLRLWHLASLDAPTVAVVWSLALARVAAVRMPVWIPALLALGTWAVYVGDRLLDAQRALRTGDTQPLRERHWFHWRHRQTLVLLASVAACMCVVLIMAEMPAANRERNSVLAAAALAYFGGVHLPRKPRWFPALASKELLVGLLFASGCAAPALLRANTSARIDVLIAAAYLATLAWLNCFAIDRWEASPHARIAGSAGVLAVVGLLSALALHASHPAAAALVGTAAASAALLALLDAARTRMTPLMLRAAADLVLLTPVVLLR